MGFGIFGYRTMWDFSERIYKLSNPTEVHIFDDLRKMQKYMSTKSSEAIKKSKCYRIHPLFAGMSLITTALLAFSQNLSNYDLLRALNVGICIVLAVSA